MASLLPNGEQVFLDNDGNPLSDGTVEFYIPATLTPKDTWQDASQTILNTNPVELDAAGRAIIYGEGVYRQIVKDSEGNTIWDQLTTGAMATSTVFGGDIVGTTTALVMTPTVPLGSLGNGVTVWGFATQNNGANATLNVSGLGAKSILLNGAALPANVILEDTVAAFTYETATDSWHLENWEGAGLGRNDFEGVQNEAQSTNVVAAGTIDLDTITGNLVDVTGNTGISAITLRQGAERVVRFTGTPLITNGASLVLPGGSNIQAAAGDFAIFRGYAAGVARCVAYIPATGYPVKGGLTNVVQTTKTDVFTTTSTSFTNVTGGSVAITTKRDTSRVLVLVMSVLGKSDGNSAFLNLLRASSTLIQGDAAGNRVRCTTWQNVASGGAVPVIIAYMDSPGSAATHTYSLQMRVGSAGGTGYINAGGADSDSGNFGRSALTMIAVEIEV